MQDLIENIILEIKLTKNIMDNEHNKYIKPLNISSEQGLLLKFVYEMPGLTQTKLAELVHKDKTTITRMIDSLEKKGFVVRKNSDEDRRIYKIYLTKETEEMAKQLNPIFQKQIEDLKNIIGKDDYKVALRVMGKIKKYYKGLNK
ncbi:MarR family winged helix-turn-helix transcriptional regulator [Sulfurospirillum sp. 1307]|jgi:DNA-binding MarR family transcriptional regulator